MKARKFKRIISSVTALALSSTMLGCLVVSAEGETVSTIKGDVTLDGKVTVADVILINKYLAGLAEFDDNQLANGDCCDDSTGVVNNIDGLAIMKLIGGKIDSLPVSAQSSYDVPFTSQIISNYNSSYNQGAALINTYQEYQAFKEETDSAAIARYHEEGLITDNSQIIYPEYDEDYFNTKSVVIQKTTMSCPDNSIEVSAVGVTNNILNTTVNYGVPYPSSSQCAMTGYIIAVQIDKENVPENIEDFSFEKVRVWDEEYLKTAPITVYDPMNDPNYEGIIEDGLDYVYTDSEAWSAYGEGYSADIYLPNKRADLVTVTFTDTGDVYTLKEVMKKGWVTASRLAQNAPQTLKFCWIDPITGEWVNWEE